MSDETMAELVEQLHLHADLSPDATTESADLAKDAATALERLAAENAELREAGRALVMKLDAMIEDTNPIFAEMQIARGRPYTGAQIGDELEAFRQALGGDHED